MAVNDNLEKRQLVRLLCNKNFSSSRLNFKGTEFILQSINFHHQGMRLFDSNRLPNDKQCTISFSYKDNDELIEIHELACIILHSHETDTGNQYGIQFIMETMKPDVFNKLLSIEASLLAQEDICDRYGLYN